VGHTFYIAFVDDVCGGLTCWSTNTEHSSSTVDQQVSRGPLNSIVLSGSDTQERKRRPFKTILFLGPRLTPSGFPFHRQDYAQHYCIWGLGSLPRPRGVGSVPPTQAPKIVMFGGIWRGKGVEKEIPRGRGQTLFPQLKRADVNTFYSSCHRLV